MPGSPSSVELAGALKSKSRSLPGLLIVHLRLPDIEPSSSNRILYVTDIGLTHSLRVSASEPIENGFLYERSRPAWPTSGAELLAVKALTEISGSSSFIISLHLL